MPAVFLTPFHHEKEEKVRNENEENVPHTLSAQLKQVSEEGNKETCRSFRINCDVLLYLYKFSKCVESSVYSLFRFTFVKFEF